MNDDDDDEMPKSLALTGTTVRTETP